MRRPLRLADRDDSSGVRPRVRRSRLAELELASTSDIAFLLLIFFLSTAVFASQTGLAFLLPPAGRAAAPAAEPPARVAVDASGRISVAGVGLDESGLATWARTQTLAAPDRLFVVEVDPRCAYEHLVTALDALQRASVRRVTFRGSDA